MLHSKSYILVSLLTTLLSSCYSYKNLTRNNPVTQDVLLKLEPGKDYKFELMTGQRFKVHIDSSEVETIRGWIYQRDADGKVNKLRYSSTFSDVENYVAKISVRESDPIKITSLIALSALSMFIIYSPPLLID